MDSIKISQQLQAILERLEGMNEKVSAKPQDPKTVFLDNADAMRFLKVSRRTLMSWRSEGLISYSQCGSKLFYSLFDIQEFMQRHYKKRFA